MPPRCCKTDIGTIFFFTRLARGALLRVRALAHVHTPLTLFPVHSLSFAISVLKRTFGGYNPTIYDPNYFFAGKPRPARNACCLYLESHYPPPIHPYTLTRCYRRYSTGLAGYRHIHDMWHPRENKILTGGLLVSVLFPVDVPYTRS